ncbi:MAG: rane-associated protein [Frankiales bacterium]|nr:rane-associated protein [Frankiales bacterium]MDX6254293.1 rane-associated protein [Frankiales bacterium]
MNLLDAKSVISTFGTIGIIAIIFAETGLLIGLFLPGDSLLFTAGVACAGILPGIKLNLAVIMVGTVIAAIAGGQFAYGWGRKGGPMVFKREDSRLFKQSYVVKAGEYLERYGAWKAIVLARFMPGIRALVSPLLGAAKHDAREFALWNAISGVVWPVLVLMLGWGLGKKIGKNTNIDKILLPIILGIVVLSVLPTAVEILRERRRRKAAQS